MKYEHLMIDLETMGKPPSAAIVGIGACFFNMSDCTIGPTFYRAVNLATSVRDGGTLDPGTIMWWLFQSQEARNAIQFNAVDVRSALADLSDLINEHSRARDVRVWGNSSGFDLTILGGAYIRPGMAVPWHFTNEKCFRTLRGNYPSVEYNPAEKGADAHRADADAIFQTKHLFKIKNRNKHA